MTALHLRLREAALRQPPARQEALRRTVKRLRRLRSPQRWGTLRRTTPVSSMYGFERGTPIDRVAIERFLARHAADIAGTVGEVGDLRYTRAFGRDRVQVAEIIDLPQPGVTADVLADLGEPDALPEGRYDCLLLLQTVQYVRDLGIAFANAWRALAPGGVLLVSVPCLGRVDASYGSSERWRLTPRALREELERHFPADAVEVEGAGNVLTAVALLYGLAAEELRAAELDLVDPAYPLVACGRARKPHAA